MKKIISILLCLAMVLAGCLQSFAASEVSGQPEKTAAYLLNKLAAPGLGEQGGDWAVMALSRGDFKVPEGYYQSYYGSLAEYLQAHDGVLSARKYTEYSRTVVVLSALGADPTDVGGYNLLMYLADFNAVKWQGVNGPAWALIALDCRGYEIPENSAAAVQATRQMYIDYILSKQLADGGFSLSGSGSADIDLTCMVLQALAKYQEQAAVKAAVDKALACLAGLQKENGLFDYSGAETCETLAQLVVALCELGISPEDERFVKGGKTLVDGLLSFALEDGSFEHIAGKGTDQMATEQAFYALVDARRVAQGKSSLYRMDDAEMLVETAASVSVGLAGKNADVNQMPVTKTAVSFSDIDSSAAKDAIVALASREIINGFTDGTFQPDATMTRAQFAAIITKGLGLTPEDTGVFTDVKAGAWYAAYVGTANKYGIVSGKGEGRFDPNATITKQEAAIMIANAAKLCGMDTAMDETATRDVLAQFGDYTQAASWAQPQLAFCYAQDILDQSEMNIEPRHQVTRAEIAQMVCNLLEKARLL